MPLGTGDRDLLTDLPVILNIGGDKARVVPLDRDVILTRFGQGRGAAQRVGAGGDGAADGNQHGHILSGSEERKPAAVRCFEYDRFRIRAILPDVRDHDLLLLGVVLFGLLVGGQHLGKGSRRGGLDVFLSDLGDVLELQHIQLAEEPDFYIGHDQPSSSFFISASVSLAMVLPLKIAEL